MSTTKTRFLIQTKSNAIVYKQSNLFLQFSLFVYCTLQRSTLAQHDL